MAYGTIKVDTITFTDGGVDKSVSVSGLVENPTFTGNVTATGTISGDIVRGQTISGVTVTGTTANFTSGNFTNISGGTHTITSGVFALGTAADPSISFVSDPNTGIYSPGANQVAISTNGTGRVFIDSQGRLGIGSTPGAGGYQVDARASSTSASVVIGATASDYSTNFLSTYMRQYGTAATGTTAGLSRASLGELVFQNGSAGLIRTNGESPIIFATADSERMRLDSSGRLGVGTSSPDALLTVNGVGAHGLGSAAAPSFAFTGDLNTGIYSPGADQLAISTNGTQRIFAGSGGNVGIGPSTSLGALIDANTTGTDSCVIRARNDSTSVYLDANNGYTYLNCFSNHPLLFGTNNTERARIDSSGRLLVGTSSVTGVQHSAAAGTFDVDPKSQINTLSAACTLLLRTDFPSNESGSLLALAKSRGSGVNSNTIVANGDTLGEIGFFGADGTDIRSFGASIQCRVDGTPGANDMPGRLVFSTTGDGSASPTEAIRITNDRVIAYNQAAPAAVNATATLTVANLKTGIITSTSAAATDMTLPTGTLTEGGFAALYDNFTFEWSVINTGPSLVRVLAGTAHTIVGSGSVATGTSGRFASRRTAANTFVTYRLS